MEEAKRKARADQEEKARKEAQDKKAQEERAIQEAAQALTGVNTQQIHSFTGSGMGAAMRMGPEKFQPRPSMPMAAYASKPGPFLAAVRPSFFSNAPDPQRTPPAPNSAAPPPPIGAAGNAMHPSVRGNFSAPPGVLGRMGYGGIGTLGGGLNRFGMDGAAPRFMGMGQASQMLNAQAQVCFCLRSF